LQSCIYYIFFGSLSFNTTSVFYDGEIDVFLAGSRFGRTGKVDWVAVLVDY
jgi:hypothetical protein